MVNGKVGFGKERMCSYKHTHNSAVHTEYMKKKILNHMFKNKSNMTRIDWLIGWMSATGMNHYQGITFEAIYSVLSGNAPGVNQPGDQWGALNNLLGPLGGGFLDHPNMVATPGQNDGTSGARDAGSGVYIDGLEVSASAAGIAMNNEAFAQNVDWKNTSTGNALLDATISKELDGNGVFLVGEYSQGVVVQNGQKILIGDAKLLKIIEVDYSRWLLAHVSAANAAKYLASVNNRSNQAANGGVIDRLNLQQANKHYRNGNGTPLTVDASKIDLSGVDPSILGPINGRPVQVNLLTNGSRDGLVYGKLDLINKGNGRVQIISNTYDFDTGAPGHPWFGAGSTFWRNIATVGGNVVARPGTPYLINFHGLGDLNYRPAPFLPQWPTGPKY